MNEFLYHDWPHSADGVTMSREHMSQIRSLSIATAQLRTQVPKNRAGVVSFVPEAEVGTRLAMQLTKLAKGLTMVRGASTFADAEYEIVRKVAEDSIPSVRLRLVSALADLSGPANHYVDTSAVSDHTALPLPSAKAALDDLRLLGMAERKGERPIYWRLDPQLRDRLAASEIIVPDNALRLSVVQMPGSARE
jgi:hypothetical protein